MATTTPFLGLIKPAGADQYDINIFNANSDKIDAALGKPQGSIAYKTTITTTGWKQGAITNDTYWQEYTISNANIAAGDAIIVIPGDIAAETIIKDSIRSFVSTSAGSLKLYANKVPVSSFTIYYIINKQEA